MKKLMATVMGIAVLAGGALGAAACDSGDVIKIGVTNYKPMDYLTDDGKWVGFDAELATKVFENLGYKVKFVEIEWETKVVTLNSGEIDVIWNGMTVTDSLKQNLTLSNVYLENLQYGIVKAENLAQYSSVTDLAGKKVAYESGSAAASLLENIECTKTDFTSQSAAVMEVAAGTSDIAVIDYTMATALTAEGSDYYGRLSAVDLGFEVEEYAVGFRKADTQLCDKVNTQLAELKQSGFMRELAQKYGVENLLKD